MDLMEQGLAPGASLGEGADFFVKLKYGSAGPRAHQLEDLQARLKAANATMGYGPSMSPPTLPPTALGKNMAMPTPPALPATAMGQNKVGSERGPTRAQERAHEQLETKYEKHQHTKNERHGAHLGGATGAITGGLMGHYYGKHPVVTAAGVLAGATLGKALGKDRGTSADLKDFKKKHAAADIPPLPPVRANAVEKAIEAAEPYGKALGAVGAVLGLGYLAHHAYKNNKKHAAEGAMGDEVPIEEYLAAEQEGDAVAEENQTAFLRQRLQEAHAQLQAMGEQGQMAEHGMAQLQQAQMSHEQQLQSAQQQSQLATEAAMQNVQQSQQAAMQAMSQALEAKDDALRMHQLAAQMRMAYQDMRGQVMDSVSQDPAAGVGEAIKAEGMQSEVLGPEGAPGGAQGGLPGPEGEAGAPPPPGASPPDAGAPTAKAAGVMQQLGGLARERAPYAAVGAAIGGTLPLLEAARGHDDLRGQVAAQEQEYAAQGGFGRALRLAQSKARLAVGEISERHPMGAAALGAAGGAVFGAAQGPEVFQMARALPGQIQELRGKR